MEISLTQVIAVLVAAVTVGARFLFGFSWWWVLGILGILALIAAAIFAGKSLIQLARKHWPAKKAPSTATLVPSPAGGAQPAQPQNNSDFVGETMPPKYWVVIAGIYIVYLAIFSVITLIAIVFVGWFGLAIMLFALSFAISYTFGSFKRVDTKKIAVKTFFGGAIQRLGSGLVFAPRGIFDVAYLPKGIISFHIGQIRGKQGEPEEEGYQSDLTFSTKTPFRVMFKQDDDPKAANTDPLKRQQTTDPNVVILLQITDPVQFINNVGDLETAYDNVRDAVAITFQEYCGKRTLRTVLSNLEEAVDAIKDTVENLIGDQDAKNPPKGAKRWGVNIIKIGIPSLGLSFDVNSAIAKATAAGFAKVKLTEEGVGNANARRELLMAEAKGETAIAKGLDSVKLDLARAIVAAQALQAGLKGANYSVVPGDSLFGLLATARQMLKGLPATQRPQGQKSQGSQPSRPTPTTT